MRQGVLDKIVDAYMQLVATQDRSSITTTQICRQAGVHRSSFYLHFESVADLESQFLTFCIEQALGAHDQAPLRTEAELIQTCLALVSFVKAKRAFFEVVFREPNLSDLEQRWMTLVSDWFRIEFSEPALIDDDALWELILDFFGAILGRFLRMALEGKSSMSDEQLAQWMLHYQFGGLLRMGKKEKEVLPVLDPAVEQLMHEGAANKSRKPKLPQKRFRSPDKK